jgi:uncharacterized protein YbaR (Trm112 family)
MTRFRCPACRGRVGLDGSADTHACPECGGPLEAVTRAQELVGLRVLGARPRPHGPLADQVRATIARNDAARRRRLRAARRDAGSPDAD